MLPDAMTCKDDLNRFIEIAARRPNNILESDKLDGVRTMAIVMEPGAVVYVSRNKKWFPNFGKFDAGLSTLAQSAVDMGLKTWPVVFDGEVISTDKRFSKVMTQLRRQTDIDDSIFEYHLFDFWMAATPLKKRLEILGMLISKHKPAGIAALEHRPYVYTGMIEAKAFVDEAIARGLEGKVFKTADGFYQHKRSSLWCKCKAIETADVPVVGYEMGGGRLKGKLGALVVDFHGVRVNVGTGFDDNDRVELLIDLPKVVEISYQEVTEAGSLRHPRFIRVRDDKDVKAA